MKYFDFSRFWLLLKMELYRSRKGFLISFVIAFDLLLAGFIMENIFSSSRIYDNHGEGYAFGLLAGGFILTSLAFRDLGNNLKRYHYLTLPASTFEKFMSMWFLTCIGWIVAFSITFIFYSILANSIGRMIFQNMTFMPFQPWDALPLTSIRYYIIFQSVFLVGAVHFRGFVFPKVLFTLLLFALVCGLIFFIMMSDIFSADITWLTESNPMDNPMICRLWIIIKWLMWWILAPLCWVTAYVGLKEQEV